MKFAATEMLVPAYKTLDAMKRTCEDRRYAKVIALPLS